MIAIGIPSRKDRDLLRLSARLGTAIPGWDPDPDTLTILTQAALAYLDAGEGYPEPSQDCAWAIACVIGLPSWRWPDQGVATAKSSRSPSR